MKFPSFKTTPINNNNQCLTCGAKMPAASGNGAPVAGDLSICVECEALAIFNADLSIRRPTPAEALELAVDPGVKQCLLRLRQAKARAARKIRRN